MSEFILFDNVQKAFGPAHIYDGLNLRVERGTALTIVGGSGVGKSVLLKMLIGLLRPDSGSIIFDGTRVDQMNGEELSHVRKRIGMLFQGGALFDSMTVGENVAYGLEEHFRDTMGADQVAERVHWALELVGLSGIEAMDPADLSGGMKKRVALARAIAVRPEVLLYDEPTTGLDPINTARVNNLIVGLRRKLKITSIVVTHDMKSVFTISERVAMVHGGQIIIEAPTEEFRHSTDPRVSDFIEGRAPANEDVDTLLHT